MSQKRNPYSAIKGWVEVLYRKEPILDAVKGNVIQPGRLEREDYHPVGSWLPLEEYVYTLEIVDQYLGDVSGIPNIPRPIGVYDAITLCPTDPPSINTLVLLPEEHAKYYDSLQPQAHSQYGLLLCHRPEPFASFRMPHWPYGNTVGDDDADTWRI